MYICAYINVYRCYRDSVQTNSLVASLDIFKFDAIDTVGFLKGGQKPHTKEPSKALKYFFVDCSVHSTGPEIGIYTHIYT